MAPSRKSRSVNKRFSYINEVASSKGGENANKSRQRGSPGFVQKKRKLSDMLGAQWSKEELERFYAAYRKFGKDWKKVAAAVRNRSADMVEALYSMNKAYLSLPAGTASVVGLIAMMTDHYCVLMAHEPQNADDKMWPPHVEHIFIEIMLEEQLKGNMENGVFKGPMWASITAELNQRTGKNFPSKKVVQKHNRLRLKRRKWSQLLRHTGLGWDEQTQTVTSPNEVWANVIAGNRQAANLRKQGCPNYDKLKQLFAHSTATGNLQISSNTPPLTSDEERALEEEFANANANANANAPTHLDDDCYTPNFESFLQTVEDAEVEEATQRVGKRPMQDANCKGKKVSKKADRVNDMIVALKEYTAMRKERYDGKLGRSSSTSEQFAQSNVGGDPCSLGKAIELLNKYEDLNNKAYVKISKALQQKDNRVVFMGMPEHRRKAWMEDILNPEED